MSFLFPLYLLGALAIALPVLVHLRKRPPKDKIPFGSTMFLDASPEQLTRRTRVEHWLLLALRCLALLALALVFGRPFLKSRVLSSELPSGSIAVLLIDRSASMQREDLAQQAVEAASRVLHDRKSEDDIAVIAFDREPRSVVDFVEWSQRHGRARVRQFESAVGENGWDISNPGKAMIQAADRLAGMTADNAYRKHELILISDFQEGADFDALNQFAWPKDLKLTCIPITAKEPGNLSITLAATSEESRSATKLTHRVRIENSAESTSETFKLGWKGDSASAIDGVVPPGSSRVIQVPEPKSANPSGELMILGDSHPYDNTVYIAPPRPVPLSIQFFSDREDLEKVGSPYFYLNRALHGTASLEPRSRTGSLAELHADSTASAIIIHGAWTAEQAKIARALGERGRLVIALPTAQTTPRALGELIGEPNIQLTHVDRETDYELLADLDFDHPILAPFARAKIRDFTKVRFWRHRALSFPDPDQLPDQMDVLARFDSGPPAWLSQAIGEGSLFVFLSGWEPEESQFGLSSKFVPVLYSIFENAGYSAKAAPTIYVGITDVLNESGDLVPAGRPGVYRTQNPDGSETQLGVNLHPSQGRIDPIDPHTVLSDFDIPMTSADPSAKEPVDQPTKRRLENAEKEASQKLWKWLLIAVLLFLLAETWLSGRRSHATVATN